MFYFFILFLLETFCPTDKKTYEQTKKTTIANGVVGIHLLQDNERPLIIIIENPVIAETYMSFFEVLWRIAEI